MYLEVGACVWAYAYTGSPALVAVGLLAAYHCGALLRTLLDRRLGKTPAGTNFVLAAAIISICISFVYLNPAAAATSLLVAGFVVPTGEFAPKSRDVPSGRTRKIAMKSAGMLLPVLIVVSVVAYGLIALAAAVVLMARATRSTAPLPDRPSSLSWTRIDAANVFHQAGYFVFCFSFWILIPGLDAALISFLFPIGWVGYWFMELRLARAAVFRPRLLSAGHIGFAAALMLMAAMTNHPAIILMGWFATGLFGGTCYTMDFAPTGRPSNLSDAIGALVGSASAVLVLSATGLAAYTLLLGAAFACATSAFAFTLPTAHSRKG